jgi:hypothetical protein
MEISAYVRLVTCLVPAMPLRETWSECSPVDTNGAFICNHHASYVCCKGKAISVTGREGP